MDDMRKAFGKFDAKIKNYQLDYHQYYAQTQSIEEVYDNPFVKDMFQKLTDLYIVQQRLFDNLD